LEQTSDTDNHIIQIFNLTGVKLPIKREVIYQLISKIEAGESVSYEMLELVYIDEDEIIKINQTVS
jgi:predicted phosphatase